MGSERTIDLVFENTASREASYQLFDLLVKSVHEKAKQKQLSQYRNALVVKKRNKYSDFMAAIKMSRALMSQAGVRVNLVLPHGLKEPRNLRLLHGGRLVPTTLSFEEVRSSPPCLMKIETAVQYARFFVPVAGIPEGAVVAQTNASSASCPVCVKSRNVHSAFRWTIWCSKRSATGRSLRCGRCRR